MMLLASLPVWNRSPSRETLAPVITGIDSFLGDADLGAALRGRRVALLAHPASVGPDLSHSLDRLADHSASSGMLLSAAFGPQHGLRGDKQDNMVESADYVDPRLGIPVFSLYGEVRRPTQAMLDRFDVLLVDLQDLGCRIYTFVTTLLYVLEAAAAAGKEVWVLDRPNPAGRPVEGLRLRSGWESFVGAADMPMRHGMTLGEMAAWFVARLDIDVAHRVVPMQGWSPAQAPGFGWPEGERSWVNPSPNATTLSMARCYAGTVMLEGTTLSEGRGTTRPLEVMGAPDLNAEALLATMASLAPQWMRGCRLRPCFFEPTFHKHVGELCSGFQIHVDDASYRHDEFQPWRLQALVFKALRKLRPDYPLWRDFPYEYEIGRLAIDVINGGPLLREWVDDPAASIADFESIASADEQSWREEREAYLLYST